MQEKPIAWIFGATGLTGQGIAKGLVGSSLHTIAHLRPNSSSQAHVEPIFDSIGVETKVVAWDEEAIRSALAHRPPSVVFLALGTTRARSKVDGEGYEIVDYGYTKLVIDIVLAAHPSCRLVYVSAIPGGASAYSKARTRIEEVLLASGNQALIARPSLIVGNRLDDRPMERWAARILDSCLSGLSKIGLKSAGERFASMTGDDLGAGIVQLYLESFEGPMAEVESLRSAAQRFRSLRERAELSGTS